MKNYMILFAALLLVGSGCASEQASDNSESQTANGVWVLEAGNYGSASTEIVGWAETNFSSVSEVEVGQTDDNVRSIGKLSLVASYEATVIDIPEGRQIGEYPEPKEPTDFYAFVLSDEDGNLFRTFVESLDGETFKVNSFGPAKDRRVDREASDVTMSTWPVQELQDEASKANAKLVMIPYPYAMNQLYYQFGDDVMSSRLMNVETGLSYEGLNDLLDAIEADWASL